MTLTSSLDIDLLAQTAQPGANALISPASIRIALAMLARGARGETLTQLERIVGSDALAAGSDDVMRVANSIWAKGSIHASYADELARSFGAEANALGDPASAVQRINAWVAAATDEQITDLLSDGDVDSLTVLALINAITFRGTWVEAFDVERTTQRPFAAPGGAKDVAMMRRSGVMSHEDGGRYKAVKLDYEGGYSLHAILPGEGVDPLQAIRAHTGNYTRTKVDLALPRFDMRCQSNLREALTQMGCERMFSAHGELDGVSSDPLLEVSKVVHEACMTTDEKGTTAAAATAVMVRTRSASRITSMIFDRPFAFKLTSADQVLFAGVCCDPG